MNNNTITIRHKLGQGKFSVYYVECPAKNTAYALKVFPKNQNATLQYHKEKVLARLDHPNIIQFAHIQCSTAEFDGLVTEYAPYGDLFEWMINDMMSNEVLIRSYFHQLIDAMEYLHGQNLAHMDIKPENLMIGEGFRLKMVDFDQAQSLKDMWLSSRGTKCYRAPEIVDGTCLDFASADVYAAGITLYSLMTKEFPFLEGENGEISGHYKTFLENKERFWTSKMMKRGRKVRMISEEFAELINGMLEKDVSKRWGIQDIKRSRWYNAMILDYEGLREEMSLRWEKKQQAQNLKNNNIANNNNWNNNNNNINSNNNNNNNNNNQFYAETPRAGVQKKQRRGMSKKRNAMEIEE